MSNEKYSPDLGALMNLVKHVDASPENQNEDNQNYSKESHRKNYVDDLEEQQHYFDIINTFLHYKQFYFKKVDQKIQFVNKMCLAQQNLLKNYLSHLKKVQISICHNHEVIKIILKNSSQIFRNSISMDTDGNNSLIIKNEKELDVPRIDSVLKQIVREWCAEGSSDRGTCFNMILNAIEEYFPETEHRDQIKILIPGAGLGRLPFEIAKRGYSCQGNEVSLMMLIVANFILNKTNNINSYILYPWVTQFSNNLYNNHQLAQVKFPDVNPSDIPRNVDFSMAAGSFTDVFNNQCDKEIFDSVVTCFFLDTAQNIVLYIQTIWNILKPGGIWINFGPLLYHYADMSTESSIEPSYEIVKEIIESFKFKFLKEDTNIPSFYTRNPNAMLSYQYYSVFFVCQK